MFDRIASRAGAPSGTGAAPRRAETDRVLLNALAFRTENVFDAFVEVRDLLTLEAIADLRKLLDAVPTDNADA